MSRVILAKKLFAGKLKKDLQFDSVFEKIQLYFLTNLK